MTEKKIPKPGVQEGLEDPEMEQRYHLNVLTYNYYSMKGEFNKYTSVEYVRQDRMGEPEKLISSCLLRVCNKDHNPEFLEDAIAL